MFRLLPETPRDLDEVEALLDLAFAPGRTALSSYRLREGVAPVAALCRVARDEYDALAGCIRFWPALIGTEGRPTLLLGPVAVHPTRQGEGLGALLIVDALERAAGLGWERCVLVGDEPYYRRFGFTREAARDIVFPPPTNPARVLARALAPGALDGVAGEVRRAGAPAKGPDADTGPDPGPCPDPVA
ncbi:GNAT family N-acetyltransferase [Rubrimonas cliftonensis]|uniref:Predicted N-acetyltransferase YhbS n=1 Tax=Rubrimonas cliftonensis TaxID=89524 RepID=A0A1H3YV69_9RHOB|nr:N-acetyltransferase [Rubrimonas cliftonensis]SEA14924.1 Predicted N-acetyltransferase YhbS [Rubrimonas cliftonensis]